ncbi:acyl-CoA dehydrogenase family protein [Nocardioides daphniae]|uniref:acyl-CoA dehydrogenase family protein n=1 Tax=Nocardioides daphniae TaxID=402297 RepID=UPI0023B007FD|nr:acyl-CoA dehydrogenase family protein [Nocardioides daphniae]
MTAAAAAAKFWCSEQYVDVVNRCVQLHGGYGYMLEYRIAHDYLDSRISTIYGGDDRDHEGDRGARPGALSPSETRRISPRRGPCGAASRRRREPRARAAAGRRGG